MPYQFHAANQQRLLWACLGLILGFPLLDCAFKLWTVRHPCEFAVDVVTQSLYSRSLALEMGPFQFPLVVFQFISCVLFTITVVYEWKRTRKQQRMVVPLISVVGTSAAVAPPGDLRPVSWQMSSGSKSKVGRTEDGLLLTPGGLSAEQVRPSSHLLIIAEQQPLSVPAKPSQLPKPIAAQTGPLAGPIAAHPRPLAGPIASQPGPLAGPIASQPCPLAGPIAAHPSHLVGLTGLKSSPLAGLVARTGGVTVLILILSTFVTLVVLRLGQDSSAVIFAMKAHCMTGQLVWYWISSSPEIREATDEKFREAARKCLPAVATIRHFSAAA